MKAAYDILRPRCSEVTGKQLIAALRLAHGAVGSKNRVYKFIRDERRREIERELLRARNPQPDPGFGRSVGSVAAGDELAPSLRAHPTETDASLEERIRSLEQEILRERHRAELAEHREESHQDKWATEVHTLRLQVQELKEQGRGRCTMESHFELHRRLFAAQGRINWLEQQLLESRGGAGQGVESP